MSTTEARRTRDAERSKAAILDAAERLFAQHGYQGTSLQDIGDAAGVSRGTPSYFFGSKDGLYRAVLERNFASVAEVLRRIRAEGRERGEAPVDVLAHEIEGYIDFLVAHPTYVRLMQWEAVSGGDAFQEMSEYLAAPMEAMEVFREHIAEDGFRAVDPLHLLISIIGMSWITLTERDTRMRALGIDPLAPDFVAARKRHVVDLVLHGIVRRS